MLDFRSICLSLALIALAQKSFGTTPTESDCTNMISSGTVPPVFGSPGSPSLVDTRFYVRECVASGSDCITQDNREAGAKVTQYRANREYVAIFNNGNQAIHEFMISVTAGSLIGPSDYTGRTNLGNPFSGECFFHGQHQIPKAGGGFEFPNATYVRWTPPISTSAVVFRVVINGGSPAYVLLNLAYDVPNCAGTDEAQNIESCSARYSGETCIPKCLNGYQLAPNANVSCTGSGYASTSACSARVPNYCPPFSGSGVVYNCPNNQVGDSCLGTSYCLATYYSAVSNAECVPVSSTVGSWRQSSNTNLLPVCTYVGPCNFSSVQAKDPNIITGSALDPDQCRNAIPNTNCSYTCANGYAKTYNLGRLICEPTGWDFDPEPLCTLIPDYCNISTITGNLVVPGTCTTRSILLQSSCLYACSLPGWTPKHASLTCNGNTAIGWSSNDFQCLTPQPTKSPVPTFAPTFVPPPSKPTSPTVPSTPTLNPFFLNNPPTEASSNEPIFIIVGAGSGVLLLSIAVCVGLQYRKPIPEAISINTKGEAEVIGSYESNRFGKVQKLEYNAFDNF